MMAVERRWRRLNSKNKNSPLEKNTSIYFIMVCSSSQSQLNDVTETKETHQRVYLGTAESAISVSY